MSETKVKKRIRRSKSGSPTKHYFNIDTQNAIIAYQKLAPDAKLEKDKLYTKEILPAFLKLVENLVNIHKFTSANQTQDELKNDCVNFLFETIRKYDATRGTAAFSYFNVVAKRYLIIQTKNRISKMKKIVSLDDFDSLNQSDQRTIEEYSMLASQDQRLDIENSKNELSLALLRLKNSATSETELNVVNAIITIFENAEDIDIINRNATMLYLKEMSGLQQKQMTAIMQVIKKKFRALRKEMQNER